MKSRSFAVCLSLFCLAVCPSGVAGQEAEKLVREARAAARAGKKDEASKYLTEAVERGYNDAEALKKDEDLASLREDPRWAAPLSERLTGRT